MPAGGGFAFGPFHLDPHLQRLRRDGVLVPLPLRQLRLLQAFVTRPDEILTKDQLIKAAWADVVATDNSLAQAVLTLRGLLESAGASCSIETARGHGYRFTGDVERVQTPPGGDDLDALLAPHRGLMEGLAALETLQRDRIAAARETFQALVTRHPGDATIRVGLANACALAFEATRAGAAPDVDALKHAVVHAQAACGLNPDYGEAWATLGFVLERTGNRLDAVAALRRGVALEPNNWRHHLRLSYGTCGDERLRAAHRVLALLPGCPMAHLLAATVFVARDAPAQAERELDAGMRGTGDDTIAAARFSIVGLHWLKGLLLLARGETTGALSALQQELTSESRGHLYAVECSANAWYAIGVCRLRDGDVTGARDAFEEALLRVPAHPMARAGVALAAEASAADEALPQTQSVDAASARAAICVARGNVADAVQLVSAALASATPGNDGWLLPVDPLLQVGKDRAAWAPVLAMLRTRAS